MSPSPRQIVLTVVLALIGAGAFGAEVRKPVVPKSEAECLRAGGSWTVLGLPYPDKPKMCDLPATDKGKSCTDSKECQGICEPPESVAIGASASGACSAYVSNFGNVRHLKGGKVESLNVE
jgi:hypothetical protein